MLHWQLCQICYPLQIKLLLTDCGGGGGRINKAWKETNETEKNCSPTKTCLKDNIVPSMASKYVGGLDNGRFTATLLHYRSLYSHCVVHVVLH